MKKLLIGLLTISMSFNIYLSNRNNSEIESEPELCYDSEDIAQKVARLDEGSENFSERLLLLLLAELGLQKRYQDKIQNQAQCPEVTPKIITKEVPKIVYKEKKSQKKIKKSIKNNLAVIRLFDSNTHNIQKVFKERLLAIIETDELNKLPKGRFKINHISGSRPFEQVIIKHKLSYKDRAWRGSFSSKIIENERKTLSELKFNGVNSDIFQLPQFPGALAWRQDEYIIVFNMQRDEFTRNNAIVFKKHEKLERYQRYGFLVEDVN